MPCSYEEIADEFKKNEDTEFDVSEFITRGDEILLPPPNYTRFLGNIDKSWRRLHHREKDSLINLGLGVENSSSNGRAICHRQAVFDLKECKKDNALIAIEKIKTVCGKLGKQIGVRFLVSSTMAANCCVINVHGYL